MNGREGLDPMTMPLTNSSDRRDARRFLVNAPVTLKIGDREVLAYTRDLSNRGAYFYLAMTQSKRMDLDFEFTVELPPEITLSTSCRIRCRAKLLRNERTSNSLAGIAAKILDYSIYSEATLTA